MKYHKLSDFPDGLPDGFCCRLVSGRTIYKEIGWMWRERSDNQFYVSRTGEFKDRRYLPDDTGIHLIPKEIL